jgi:hypothetical protein
LPIRFRNESNFFLTTETTNIMIHSRIQSLAAAALTACLAAATLVACGGADQPSGQFIGYVNDTVNPEDMVLIPESNWVVASTDKTPEKPKTAYLYAIDARTGVAKSVDAKVAPVATAGDPSCTSIPLGSLEMSGLGLARSKGANGSHQLMAVNRGQRMSIEFFEIDMSGSSPAFTWTGCLLMPAKAFPNDVASTANGGLAVSVSFQTDNTTLIDQLVKGENTGYLLEWTKQTGFTRVPNSESSLTNGVEVDPDGKFYYLSNWGAGKLLRLPTSAGSDSPLVVDIGLRPDNLTWTKSGTLIVAGHFMSQSPADIFGCVGSSLDICPVPFKIIEVDPRTLSIIRVLVDGTTMNNYAGATTGLEVGNEIWASSFRYNKIARYWK